jgi:flavodoxin
MRALVVFESMFGNTEAVARAVADGLSARLRVDVVAVTDAPRVLDDDLDLLVVGGPTHAFGMSRERTRRAAVEQGARPVTSPACGLREWVSGVRPATGAGPAVATFDTRIRKRGVPGSAARGAMRRLRGLGLRPAGPACSFFVTDTSGPLGNGELDRARAWGEWLATERSAPGEVGAAP